MSGYAVCVCSCRINILESEYVSDVYQHCEGNIHINSSKIVGNIRGLRVNVNGYAVCICFHNNFNQLLNL